MSKRHLSNRQRATINKRQQQHVDDLVSDVDLPDRELVGPASRGVVVCNFGNQLEVESLEGDESGMLYRCFQRSNLPPLVAGDRVVFQLDSESSGVVIALDDRHNVFSRPSASGELKPVASNIDLVMIVIAPFPPPFMNLIDRYLVAVECLHLTPILVINKSDLVDDSVTSEINAIATLYAGLGYSVIRVSALGGEGFQTLRETLKDKTAIIVGQSGVGKSSLINTMSPGLDAQVGALSLAAYKGTHTTTSARLFHLDGCDLIDSPGIREFGLWHIGPQQLLEGFIEFRPFLGNCKFRDCSHRTEPHCALRNAVEAGIVSKSRVESFFHILGNL